MALDQAALALIAYGALGKHLDNDLEVWIPEAAWRSVVKAVGEAIAAELDARVARIPPGEFHEGWVDGARANAGDEVRWMTGADDE